MLVITLRIDDKTTQKILVVLPRDNNIKGIMKPTNRV